MPEQDVNMAAGDAVAGVRQAVLESATKLKQAEQAIEELKRQAIVMDPKMAQAQMIGRQMQAGDAVREALMALLLGMDVLLALLGPPREGGGNGHA